MKKLVLFLVLFLICTVSVVSAIVPKAPNSVLREKNRLQVEYGKCEQEYNRQCTNCGSEGNWIRKNFHIANYKIKSSNSSIQRIGWQKMGYVRSCILDFYRVLLLERVNNCEKWEIIAKRIDNINKSYKLPGRTTKWKTKATKALVNAKNRRSSFKRYYEKLLKKVYGRYIRIK